MTVKPLRIKLNGWTLVYNITTNEKLTDLIDSIEMEPIDSYGSLPPIERDLIIEGVGIFNYKKATHFYDSEFEYISFPRRCCSLDDIYVYMRALQ